MHTPFQMQFYAVRGTSVPQSSGAEVAAAQAGRRRRCSKRVHVSQDEISGKLCNAHTYLQIGHAACMLESAEAGTELGIMISAFNCTSTLSCKEHIAKHARCFANMLCNTEFVRNPLALTGQLPSLKAQTWPARILFEPFH